MQLSWLKRKDSSLEELVEQHQAATEAHTAALTAVEAAQDAFDGDGADPRPLLKARESAQLAGEHLARATRLLEAARAREAEADRQRMIARAAELRELLRHDGVSRELQPMIDREVALLVEVAQVRAERIRLHDRLIPLRGEYHGIMTSLGRDPTIDDRLNLCTNAVAVESALRARTAEYQVGDPMRALLRELAPEPRSYSRQ